MITQASTGSTHSNVKEIAVLPKFTTEALQALVHKEIMAIRVPDFYDPDCGQNLGDCILEYTGKRILHESGQSMIPRVSSRDPMFQGEKRPMCIKQDTDFLVRQATGKHYPVSEILQALNEAWPKRAIVSTEHPQYVGKGVLHGPETNTYPHCDYVQRGDTGNFAANIYLILPPEGGELQMMRNEIFHQWQQQNVIISTGSGTKVSQLQDHPDWQALSPGSSCLIRPEAMELVLADVTQPHAVRPSKDGCRVNFNVFIKQKRQDSPFIIYQ